MTTRFSRFATGLIIAALLTACTPDKDQAQPIEVGDPADLGQDMIGPQAGPAPVVTPVPIDASCPDDGPRFPVSGICVGRGTPYMDMGALLSEAPDGCEWTTKELALPLGDAVLYRSLDCGTASATLALAGGAQTAALEIATSALGALEGTEIVRIFGDGESDPITRIT